MKPFDKIGQINDVVLLLLYLDMCSLQRRVYIFSDCVWGTLALVFVVPPRCTHAATTIHFAISASYAAAAAVAAQRGRVERRQPRGRACLLVPVGGEDCAA